MNLYKVLANAVILTSIILLNHEHEIYFYFLVYYFIQSESSFQCASPFILFIYFFCFGAKPNGSQGLLLALSSEINTDSAQGTSRVPETKPRSVSCKESALSTVHSLQLYHMKVYF